MTQLDEADLKSLAKVLQLIKFSLSRDAGQRRYCFIIGSGASVSSGIPTGAQLVDRWLEELYHQRASPEIRRQLSWQEWANEDTLSISGFSIAKRASFYGSIFKQTFQDDLGIGRGHLAQVMAGKVPSYGYSVLARVLGYTENKVVITTNFDHLLEESLGRFAYSDAKIIHDPYLSQYIGNYVTDPNPLVLKLHGDIYFNTYNTIDEITEFSEAWHDVFRDIFSKSTPIFIGYGGHDPGFMNSLANLKASSVQGAPIWFYRTTPPDNEHVRKFIANTNGQMIKSPDFDELMLLLGSVFDISTAEKQHEVEREIDRAAWMRNFEHVTQPIIKKVTATGADKSYQFVIREATMALLDTDRRDAWWNWHYKAQLATNKRKAARVYIEGLSSTNNNLILKACYQSFRIRSGMDKATAVEELISTQSNASDEYGEQSPETLTVQYQLARALEFVGTKSSYKEADRLYAGIVRQRQLQLSKKHPDTIAAMEAFGSYLCNTRRHQQGIDVLSEALECRVEANGEEHQLTKATRKSISLGLNIMKCGKSVWDGIATRSVWLLYINHISCRGRDILTKSRTALISSRLIQLISGRGITNTVRDCEIRTERFIGVRCRLKAAVSIKAFMIADWYRRVGEPNCSKKLRHTTRSPRIFTMCIHL